MAYNLDTFLKPLNETDKNIQILDTNLNNKWTIAPFMVKNTYVSNNLLKISLKSGKDITIDFRTSNEAKDAIIRLQSQLDILVNITPQFIDKNIVEYFGQTGSSGATGPQGPQGPQGSFDGTLTSDMVNYTPFGNLTASNVEEALQQIELQISNSKIIEVKKGTTGPGQFSSIKDAVDSITTSSTGNPFLVRVEPGVYFEDPITMSAGIHIIGSPLGEVLIIPNNNANTIIYGADGSSITGLILNGASNGTGVYHQGGGGTGFLIKDCNFNNCANYIHSYGNTLETIVYVDRCSFTGNNTTGILIDNTGSVISRVILTNCTYSDLTTPVTSNFIRVVGNNTLITMTNTTLRISPTSGTTCISVEDGGEVRIIACTIRGFEHAIHSVNNGLAPNLILDSISITDSLIYDLLIEHPSTTGRFFGTVDHTKTYIDINAPFYVYNTDLRVIKVSKKGGDFDSINDAINSIVDMSDTNRYLVTVGPGIYTEPTIDISTKPYISIVGSSIESVIIEPINSDPVFNIGANNELSFFTIQNATIGIRIYDTGEYTQAHKVSFNNCDIGIEVTSNSQDTFFYGEYIDFNGDYSIGVKIIAENGFRCFANLENYYNLPTGTASIGTFITGDGCDVNLLASGNFGNGGDIGFYIEDGATANISSSDFDNWNIGIKIGNVGLSSTLTIHGTNNIENLLYNLVIEDPSATGWFDGYLPIGTYIIPDESNFFITNKDQKIITVSSKKGSDFTSIKDAMDSLVGIASSTNRYLVQVGPGVYIEDTITLVPYVTLYGSGDTDTIIQVNDPSKNVIIGADNSTIEGFTLTGATSSGYCALLWRSTTATPTTSMSCNRIRFGDNDILARNEPIGVKSLLRFNDVKIGGEYKYNYGFQAISSADNSCANLPSYHTKQLLEGSYYTIYINVL